MATLPPAPPMAAWPQHRLATGRFVQEISAYLTALPAALLITVPPNINITSTTAPPAKISNYPAPLVLIPTTSLGIPDAYEL